MYYEVKESGKPICVHDYLPEKCPLCHHAMNPQLISHLFITKHDEELGNEYHLRMLWACARQACREPFITYYEFNHFYHKDSMIFEHYKTAPMTCLPQSFTQAVASISPNFVQIYNQAAEAENSGLGQICGPGYRKALEYLIKDYICRVDSGKEEEIKGKNLGKCIAEDVTDPNIKTCAKRAVWLGNDETHYTRKWEDKDIKDLKRLIKLTVNWIESEVMTRIYEEEMPE